MEKATRTIVTASLRRRIDSLLRTTDLTLEQIAETLEIGYKPVYNRFHAIFDKAERLERKSKSYARSKQGELNPMFGKCGEQHHSFVGDVSDNKGYLMVLKPTWYTGRRNSKHVFKHSVVMCEHLGITEIPAGYAVHHIDHNPLNNDISNLVMLTNGDHSRLHAAERATTIPKGSRAKAKARSAEQPSE